MAKNEAEHVNHRDEAIAMLNAVRDRDGADAAVHAAKLMIDAAAAWIAQEHGPEEAHRILHIAGLAP